MVLRNIKGFNDNIQFYFVAFNGIVQTYYLARHGVGTRMKK